MSTVTNYCKACEGEGDQHTCEGATVKKLSEIRDGLAIAYKRKGFTSLHYRQCRYAGFRHGFDAGVTEFSNLLKAKIANHEKVYSEDLEFNSENESARMGNESARMGRHMCKVFLEYIEECK